MNAEIIDLLRRLENMIRIGTIIDVDLSGEIPLYRVQTGELETDWIAATVQRAGTAKTSHAYTTGEQVILLSPSGDLGAALISHAVNSEANQAPDHHETRDRVTYPDGAVIEYDPESHQLKADVVGSSIVMDRDRILLSSNGSTIELSASGIELNGSRIDLN